MRKFITIIFLLIAIVSNAQNYFVRSLMTKGNTPPEITASTFEASYTYTDAEDDFESNAKPQVVALSITGNPIVGQTLTASWTFFSPSLYSQGTHLYQWYRSDQDGTNRAAIGGATNSTYVLVDDDQDKQIDVEVTAVQTAATPANGNPESDTEVSPTVYVPPFFGNITYFGSASNVADNGTNTTAPTSITPPSSMQDGDLVVVVLQHRGATNTFSVSTNGGQSWTGLGYFTGTNAESEIFWCRFDGTWDTNPQFTKTTGASAFSAIMHVFRPTETSNTWVIDGSFVSSTFTAGSSPFVKTIPSQSITQVATVTVVGWMTGDDNTWGNLSGVDWFTPGSDQYRNLGGSDQSATFAYKIQYETTGSGDVSKEQLTLGGDAGIYFWFTMHEQ